jgi:hypothetical protein
LKLTKKKKKKKEIMRRNKKTKKKKDNSSSVEIEELAADGKPHANGQLLVLEVKQEDGKNEEEASAQLVASKVLIFDVNFAKK